MRQLIFPLVCLLLLCPEIAAAQCEREWAQLLTRRNPGPGARMDILDVDIRFEASAQAMNFWMKYGPRPADDATALRIRAKGYDSDRVYFESNSAGGYWVMAESPYKACRARYLADQLDAPKRAQQLREQQLRDQQLRNQQLRDQQIRDQQARDEARRQQAERDRLNRERNLKDQLDRERQQRQALEAELRRQREEQQRIAQEEEAKRIAEEEAAYQREQKAYLERVRRDREEAKRREEEERKQAEERKPFQGRIVNECLRLMTKDESGDYGGFINSCDFDVYFAYCAYRPVANEFVSKFECNANVGSLDRIAAKGRQAAFTRGAERIYWFACNAPSTPKVTFQPATGLFGTCK